ncbi:MAG TPA: 23S rRNA (guanosine(2251)-2'-O)-methyltransferase RlmB [Ilumatobacteraceae bacterium]|nr:23S rRNA (guanosine(2251)-2'-O)-methyltransferase RlmB [Ilumatobacteraceae bacterium]
MSGRSSSGRGGSSARRSPGGKPPAGSSGKPGGRPGGKPPSKSGGKPGGKSGGKPGGRQGGRQGSSHGAARSAGSSGAGGGAKGLGGRQVEGRQAVRELVIAERRKVHEVWISAELEGDAAVADIVEIAAARRVPLLHVARARLEREARSEAPQGVLAHAAEIPEADLGELLRVGPGAGTPPFLVAVDGVTDPGNLGAIIRSCDGAGVSGVLLPRHRSVHVTPTVAKASAGAVEYVPMALVPGLPAALKQLSERGIWVVGLDDGADRSLYEIGPLATEPVCVVLGAEGAGLSRLVRERCDSIVGIPMAGHVSSLNVSTAAAIALYEVARSRQKVS